MTRNAPTALAEGSRFGQRIRRRYAEQLTLLPTGIPTRATMEAVFSTLRSMGNDPSAALRTLRQLTLERLIQLDCNESASLHNVTGVMTELAEVALNIACTECIQPLDLQYGAPPNPTRHTRPVLRHRHGQARRARAQCLQRHRPDLRVRPRRRNRGNARGAAAAFPTRSTLQGACGIIYSLIGDTTEHGFVFRVDLACGPMATPARRGFAGALEEYFQVQGREWERFAWLKSRVVAPSAAWQGSAGRLRSVVLPFVFRRYLDYNVFRCLRTCTGRSASTRPSAAPATRSAPTT
jgi:glutamate-ammonia-ligase adenylyltransferase